jgi:hypothetical protein
MRQRFRVDLCIHPDPSPVAKIDLDRSAGNTRIRLSSWEGGFVSPPASTDEAICTVQNWGRLARLSVPVGAR